MAKGINFHHTFQSAAGATGNGTAFEVGGLAMVTIQVTGTFSGTVTFEGTIDGSNWVAVLARKVTDGATGTTATAAGIYQVPVSGLGQLRARVSAYTSGSITAEGRGVFASQGMHFT